MDNTTSTFEENITEPQSLDIDTYRKFLSTISGISPVDNATDTSDTKAEMEGDTPSEPATYIANSIITYQCFTKAVNPDNLDTILKGFTPDDVFEPENVVITASIDAVCPEFTKFSFVFDMEEESGISSYNMMKKALKSFEDAKQDINASSLTEYVPFFFCELLASNGTLKCNLCNPLISQFQTEMISIIVPTSLVSFTTF